MNTGEFMGTGVPYLRDTAILSFDSALWNQIWDSARDMALCIVPMKPPCAWPTYKCIEGMNCASDHLTTY